MGILDFAVNVSLAVDQQGLGYAALLNFPELIKTFFIAIGQLRFGFSGWAWFSWLTVVAIGAQVLFIFVAVTSQAALVGGIGQTLLGLKKAHVDAGKAWHEGVKHFWPVFFLNALKRIAIISMAIGVGLAAFNMSSAPTVASTLLFGVLMVLAVTVGMVLSFLLVYAVGYVILEGYGFMQSLSAAWMVFQKHMLVSLEVGLILIGVNVLGGILALLAGGLFLGYMAVIWAVTLVSGIQVLWLIGYFLGVTALVLFVVMLGTLLTVFTTSVWTYLFVKMHKKGVKSRFLSLFSLGR